MRPGKLYTKIALTFLAVLFITLMVIFTLFITFPGKHFTSRLEAHNKAVALIAKEMIEGEIRSAPTMDLSKNQPLQDVIFNLGKILGAKIWLKQPDGTLAVKSFSGEIPLVEKFKKWSRAGDYGSFELYHRGHSQFYAAISIAFPGGKTGSAHMMVRRRGPSSPERGFALGLFIIGLIIALLIIPISRFVVKPLKKLMESAMQIAGGDLSHRVNVTSKDEIGQLCQSFNYMADKLESMIISAKELSANVSHELRTPLTRIRVAEEMLREKLEKGDIADRKRHLDDIREDITELDNLIERIMKLSKLDIHETPLTFSPFDLPDLMRDILLKLQPVIDQKALHFSTDFAIESPFSGDKDALRTALLNILDNAIKFTPEKGDITIHIDLENDMLTISVTNTHEPLPEEELAKIFDPFHRAKQTKAAGSGLGLAITKKIIERHGGAIEAQNSTKGLEIGITIPTTTKV